MRYDTEMDFLTVREVSNVLRLSILTIYKYIKELKLEAVEFGGHYRIPRSTLETFIKKHRVEKKHPKNDYEKNTV